MENKSPKLLFLDLDGTLLNDEKIVTPKNRLALDRTVAAGHTVTITTGRPLISAKMVAHGLGLVKKGCYLICFNGALIYDLAADRIIMEEVLELSLVRELFEEAEKAGIYIQTYSHEKILTRRMSPQLIQYHKLTGQDFEINEDFPDGIAPPNKVLLSDLSCSGALEQFQKDHRALEKGRCVSLFSCNEYLEYCPPDASKGRAVEKMAALFGVGIENTVAVGDERNDISMIEAAGIGVAMKNGKEQARQAADYVTERDNNHDAIAEVVEKFILPV